MARLADKLWKIFRKPPLLYVAHDSGRRDYPTVLLVHGIAATANTWGPLIKKLNHEKFRVVSVDMLGSGKSPRPKNCQYDVDDFVSSIRQTVKKLKLKNPIILVGHSMGSNIVAKYGAKYPHQIKAEYLLSLPLYTKEGWVSVRANKQTDNYIKAYDVLLKNKKFTIAGAQTIRKILNIRDGIDVNEADWEIFRLSLKNTIIGQNTYQDILNTTDIPISIIYGMFDQFLVHDNFKLFQNQPNVSVQRITTADHQLTSRFASIVARQIEADYEKPRELHES